MKSGVLALTFFYVLLSHAQVQFVNSFGEPKVTHLNERAKILTKNNSDVQLSRDFKLFNADADFIKLVLNDDFELSIFNQTEIEAVLIRDSVNPSDRSKVYKLRLNSGQIFIKHIGGAGEKSKIISPLRFESPFFQWDLDRKENQNLEIMIYLRAGVPDVRICNASSDFKIKLYDHEQQPLLKPLQEIVFTGVNENNEVMFDQLLEGRKIPKGKWGPIKPCSINELNEKEDYFKKLQNEKKNRNEQQAKAFAELRKKNDSKFLCRTPYGQFDDCQWTLEDNVCVRYRCNANGIWSARTELSAKLLEQHCSGLQSRDLKNAKKSKLTNQLTNQSSNVNKCDY